MDREIFIMRHADPHNPQKVIYGDLPGFPLSKKGKLQAQEAGQFLDKYKLSIIVTSPLERAYQTAEIIAKLNVGEPQIMIEKALKDINFGIYQGKLKIKGWWKRLLQVKELKDPAFVQQRMLKIFNKFIDNKQEGSMLFVSHAAPMAFLFQALGDKRSNITDYYQITQASIWRIKLDPEIHIDKIFEPTIK